MRYFVGTVIGRIAHNAVSTEDGVMSAEKRWLKWYEFIYNARFLWVTSVSHYLQFQYYFQFAEDAIQKQEENSSA